MRGLGAVCATLAGGLLLLACGGSIVGVGPDGGTAGQDGVPAGASPDASNRAPWCPETLPEEGTPCTTMELTSGEPACEYGTELHCSTLAICVRLGDAGGPTWRVYPPDPSCAGDPASCPASFDSGGAAECTIGTSCMYASGRCQCSTCGGSFCYPNVCGTADSGTGWGCGPWAESLSDCASTVLLGTACSAPPPGGCVSNSGQSAICANGYWSLGASGC